MGEVQLKKKEIKIPASPFCTVTSGCSFEPIMRLQESETRIILDLCKDHGEALLMVSPSHAYTTLDFPEGITNHG